MSDTPQVPSSPKIPGLQPDFRHLDDEEIPWIEVRTQRNADGSTSSVWEKWFAFSEDPQYLSLYARYDPGMIVRRHGHHSPHIVFVLDGDMWVGDRYCPAGTHIDLPLGASFGPIRAGDKGAVMFEVMMGNPMSWGDDPTVFEAAMAEHGVTALPHPPHAIPDALLERRRQVKAVLEAHRQS